MKYKVTAKKKIGESEINDWFKDSLSHMGFFTDSLSEAKDIVRKRIKRGGYYTSECVPQIILNKNGKEIL